MDDCVCTGDRAEVLDPSSLELGLKATLTRSGDRASFRSGARPERGGGLRRR
jgi:hypothetical protein